MRYLYVILAFLALLLGSCEIQKPVLPQWDVTLNIPLINKKFYVTDLVDSVNIVLGDDNILTLRGTGSIKTPALGSIKVNPNISVDNIPILSGTQTQQTIDFYDQDKKVELSCGVISSGQLGYQFADISPQANQIQITIPELKTPSGEAVRILYDGSEGWQNYDLAGCRIGTQDSGTILQTIAIGLWATSSLPDGTPLGTFDLRFNSPIRFSMFQGRLPGYEMPLEENASTINIDYPYGIEDAIQLQTARLAITVYNQLGFDAEFQGELLAQNTRNGKKRSIPILDENNKPFIANPASGEEPGITEILLQNGVPSLMQIMPDKISIVNSKFTLWSEPGTIGTARETDLITGDYQVDAPFTFELFDSTIKMQDPIKLEISKENIRRIQNNARTADLSLAIKNQLPVGVHASVYFATDKAIDPDDPATWLFSKDVTLYSKKWVSDHPNQADINAQGEQLVSLGLNEAQMQAFANPAVYMLWTFGFEASNGVVTVLASPADYVQIKSMIRLGLHIAEDK